jgi:octopine/nopaline transport system permease protein
VSEGAFILDTFVRLLGGVPLTLTLAASSVAIGATLALVLTIVRASGRPGDWLVRAYVYVMRGSPLLVQMFLIYYGLGQFAAVRHSIFWPLLREPIWCAILSLSLNTAAYGSEILRGGLVAVPAGSIEAARVCGMSRALVYRRIILPIAIRQALPAYGSEVIIMVKSTSLASIITLMEVTGIAQEIIATTYRSFEVFTCAAAIYLVINFTLARAVLRLERWLSPGMVPA